MGNEGDRTHSAPDCLHCGTHWHPPCTNLYFPFYRTPACQCLFPAASPFWSTTRLPLACPVEEPGCRAIHLANCQVYQDLQEMS